MSGIYQASEHTEKSMSYEGVRKETKNDKKKLLSLGSTTIVLTEYVFLLNSVFVFRNLVLRVSALPSPISEVLV